MADGHEDPLDYDWYATDLVFIEDLETAGYHLIQRYTPDNKGHPYYYYLREAPSFVLFLKPGEPIGYWHDSLLLTRSVWFARLREEVYEKQARLLEQIFSEHGNVPEKG